MAIMEKPRRGITLSSHIISKSFAFAKEVVETIDYSDSNQINLKKITTDHFVSKLGEEATKAVLETYFYKVDGPDYTIYKGKNKSWDHDLYVGEKGIAVKTQLSSIAERFGLSWVFQDSPQRSDPILKQPDSLVCFVECDDSTKKLTCWVSRPYKIKELTFRNPTMSYLIGKKKVVYDFDLTEKEFINWL